jgi:hypothetical protein
MFQWHFGEYTETCPMIHFVLFESDTESKSDGAMEELRPLNSWLLCNLCSLFNVIRVIKERREM